MNTIPLAGFIWGIYLPVRRGFLFLVVCLACLGSLAWAQFVVPAFSTRGQVDELFLEAFMTQFRAELAVAETASVDKGEIFTAGIAGSLNADLTSLMADTMGLRYAISGEISEDDRLVDKAPFSVRILVVDQELKRTSDIISVPLSETSLGETVSVLVKQIGSFTRAINQPVQGNAGLFVTSEPSGAEIRIDGVAVAETPLTDMLMFEPGIYEVELRKEGFKPVSRVVELDGNKERFERFVLTPVVGGSVQIRSYPNATVFLDGKDVGKTPLTVQALPGSHTIYLERTGFKPVAFDVRVENYRVNRVVQTLEPGTGTVLFWDTLPSQLIFIDAVLQTRDYVSDLASGTYLIEVREAGQKEAFEVQIIGEGVYELDLVKKQAVKFAE